MKRSVALVIAVFGLLLCLAGPRSAFALGSGDLDAAASAEFLGEAGASGAGFSVAGAGDVNGDGYDDFLVGSPYNDDGGDAAGAAYLALGGPSGWSLAKSLGQTPLVQYTGEAASDFAGGRVAGAGDVNGDGYDDFLVAAEGNDAGASNAGAAYLVLGSAAPAGGSLASAIQYTGEAVDDIANEVAGAGDVNGDGYDDFLVGAPFNDDGGNAAGAAYLVLGSAAPAGGSLSAAIQYTGETGPNLAGDAVAGAGDVNGDGYDDFLVGAWQNGDAAIGAGAAYLLLGSAAPAGGSLSSALQYTGEAFGDQAGISVAGAGDVNGDGYDDFLVGAISNNDGGIDAGAAYLVLGSGAPAGASLSSVIQYTGEAVNDRVGRSVAGAGDVNGDGYADFLIGANQNDDGGIDAGAAYLLMGSAAPAGGGLSSASQYTGEAAGDQAGISVAGAGDVNGDSYDDLLVGAYVNNDGGSGSGAAYLLFSDGLSAGAEPYRHRARLAGGGDALPVTLEQPRVTVDFTAGALSGGDVAVTRHIVHPCNNALRLEMPIWDVESAKLGGGTTLDLRFEYTDGQLGDMVEANLKLYTRDSGKPCSNWTEVAGSSVNANANAISATGLTSLSQFTIADSPPSPTMIEITGLTASAVSTAFWPAAALLLTVGASVTVLRRRRTGSVSAEGVTYADEVEPAERLAEDLAERVAAKLAERLER